MTFTASNGMIVAPHEKAYLGYAIYDSEGRNTLAEYSHLNDNEMNALREFFQHEHDEELGRWRWPENPGYVVYPFGNGAGCTALCESTGVSETFITRDSAVDSASYLAHSARAFFKADPERKPWEEAKRGEAWKLREADAYPGIAVLTVEMGWLWATGRAVDLTRIIDGERIWPEDAS